MRTFKDNTGREWSVAINGQTFTDVKLMLGVELTPNNLAPTLRQFAHDPATLANTLYLLCRSEADRRGVSDEDFGRSLRGKPIIAAVEALVFAVGDFLGGRKREMYRRVLSRCRPSII